MKPFTFKKKSEDSNHSWRYTALLECSQGLWEWDIPNRQLYISPNLRNLMGYTDEDIKEQAYAWWAERTHPEDLLEIEKKLTQAHQSGSPFVSFGLVRFQAKDGKYVGIETQAKILWDSNGGIQRMAGVITDVPSQPQGRHPTATPPPEEQTLRPMKLLSTVSHEFRSPLSGILGMTSLLKETPLSTEQLHFVENITLSTEMLLTLVNDILDVSKLNSGKFEMEKIRFSLEQVIKKTTDLVQPQLTKKNLALKITLSQDIPQFLMGDPTRLQQVLINLLTNAAKFTSQGEISLSVYEEPPSPSQHSPTIFTLRFEVSDTGIGIAPEIQANLFEDFTQADKSIPRLYGGTGLGLSICKGLVDLMEGEIGVKSELGKGSTFWFILPFEHTDEPTVLETTLELPLTPPSAAPKLNVLLVEDNQVSQEVMHGLLTLLGDDITLATNGEEAIQLFQTQQFDVVLMDLNMPIMDGLEATKFIRTLPNGDVPIIAVTATFFPGEPEKCHQHGITQVLNKPVNKILLAQTLSPYRLKDRTLLASPPEILGEKASASPKEAVDKAVFKTLLNDLGKEKVFRLLDAYCQDASELVTQIKDSPLEIQEKHAHTLAGMSENLGIFMVGKTARDIMRAVQHDPGNVPILIQDLETRFEDSLTEIQKICLKAQSNGIISQNISCPQT